MKKILLIGLVLVSVCSITFAQQKIYAVKKELITPIHKNSFNNDTCKIKKLGGNPTKINKHLVFSGATDGNRQVDPQIAVGGGYVFHSTNTGLYIYNKKGEFVSGVSQKCFNDGIDPKMFFDVHNRIFVFNLWWYYDKPKTKPANIAVSETDNPNGAWNIYPVSIVNAVDGGAVGYSKKWIAYSFPGGEERTFVLKTADAKLGKPTTVYHFAGTLGHPVFGQGDTDAAYFVDLSKTNIKITRVLEGENGEPYAEVVVDTPHQFPSFDGAPQSAQKGTDNKVSSGDKNPKLIVLQNGSIWFSQAIKKDGFAGVRWNQFNVQTGALQQQGVISAPNTNFIQSTLAVNKNNDVLVGCQQIDSTMFVSPRYAFRKGTDEPNTLRSLLSAGEGQAAAGGKTAAWGDYSGSSIDGDNLSDLWTVQSIANENGRGETRIIKVNTKKERKQKRRKKNS